MQEIDFNSYGRIPQVEVVASPFIIDDDQRLPFIETGQEFTRAGEKIKRFWATLLESGIGNQIMLAEETGRPKAFTLVEPDGDETSYTIQTLGRRVDFAWQTVDMVRLMKFKQEQQSPKANFVTIAFVATPRPRIGPLVAFDVQDESKKIMRNQFHFVDGNLYALHQVTKPAVLYPELEGQREEQFFSVGFARLDDQERVLKVEAGFVYDHRRAYWYKNIGGSLIRNSGLRISGKEVEVYEVSSDGNVYSSRRFLITEAIANVANFEPATAKMQ